MAEKQAGFSLQIMKSHFVFLHCIFYKQKK